MKDYFGCNADCLNDKKLFLFDMDGTIYLDNDLFDGTSDLLSLISERSGEYVFVTNNSSKSVDTYIQKLSRMGIETEKRNFFTSAQATVMMLNEKYSGVKVFCMGTKALIDELSEGGVNVTEDVEDDVGLVLIGFDNELTFKKLENACILLKRDIPYYATNCDLRCPVSFGYVPDCGSFCMMLKNATGREPVFIGKPEPTMIYAAMERYGATVEQTVVFGDRIYTDIEAGLNAGVTSVCVLSGEVTLDDIAASRRKPTLVFKSVKEIYREMIG